MAIKPQDLHFLMVPLMSQSHIIPLTDFAKLLAEKGVLVSILTTPLNAIRYQPMIDQARARNLKIQSISVKFPGPEAGLPEGCENLDSLTSLKLAGEFFTASEMLQEPVETLIQQLEPKPNCIISTTAVSWTQSVADKFKIPRYVFETLSCFALSCSEIIKQSKIIESLVSDSDPFLIPNIPYVIELTRSQLPKLSRTDQNPSSKLLDIVNRARASARATLVNSFEELEPWFVKETRKQRGKVYSIGPVPLCNTKTTEKYERGNHSSIQQNLCVKWLNSHKPKSVLYACFGSLSSISFEQIKHIGLGLESSNFPFIWIIRKNDCSEKVEEWLQNEAFESRTKDRGLVIRGWAPQFMILSHSSIGGFLTHCGWNSTLEGISVGVPMMTWPMFAEQFYNEKFIVDVLGIGVRFGVKEQSIDGNVITSDQVEHGIRELMDCKNYSEAITRRKRAEELGKKAKIALEEGGSSCLNMDMFIEDVILAISE